MRRGAPADPAASWDAGNGWFRPGALEGCQAVVHLAGASIGEGRWTVGRRAELRSSRIEATRLLVEHLASLEMKPEVLISASAVGFYGDRRDEELDETAEPGTGFLAELTRDWEREVVRASNLGIRTVRLRFGVILAANGGALPRMLLPFKFGAGGRLGNGKQWMPWVTLPDVVGAIEHALATNLEGVFNVVAPEPVTNSGFTKALGHALHRPTILPVPKFALRLLLGESADELLFASQRVSAQKLVGSGYAFQQPKIAAGLAAALGR